MTSAAQHLADGGGTPRAAELSAHRLHVQLVLFVVDAAYDSLLTVLDAPPPHDDYGSASDWLANVAEQLPESQADARATARARCQRKLLGRDPVLAHPSPRKTHPMTIRLSHQEHADATRLMRQWTGKPAKSGVVITTRGGRAALDAAAGGHSPPANDPESLRRQREALRQEMGLESPNQVTFQLEPEGEEFELNVTSRAGEIVPILKANWPKDLDMPNDFELAQRASRIVEVLGQMGVLELRRRAAGGPLLLLSAHGGANPTANAAAVLGGSGRMALARRSMSDVDKLDLVRRTLASYRGRTI